MPLFVALVLIGGFSYGQTAHDASRWELAWEDDFDTFDENRWLKVDYARHGDELQVYMQSAVSVAEGNLVITADETPTYCPPNPPTVWGVCTPCENKTYSYVSGWVETKAAYMVHYGLIEARIKVPYGSGFWTAFWTFKGQNIKGSNVAEIDIFEMLGHRPSDIITTNIHTDYKNELNHYQEYRMGNYSNDFHDYALEWTPYEMVWYVDGDPIRVLRNHDIVDPVRLILNFAIDPTYPPDFTTFFPAEMLVDYVKVYRHKGPYEVPKNGFEIVFGKRKTKKNKAKSAIAQFVPAGRDLALRASRQLLIDGYVSIPIGASCGVNVDVCN